MTIVATSSVRVAASALAASIVRGGAITFGAGAPILAARVAGGPKKAVASEASKGNNNNNNNNNLVKLNRLWYEIPEPLRFFCSGNLGNVCFFAIERVVHSFLLQMESPPPFVQAHTDSISFFLGYILQIVTQHALHAWLVYGLDTISTREKYLRTLFGQSGAYFIALIGSTILNTWLRRSGMPKDIAFITTLMVFACVNYFVIGWVVHTLSKLDEDGKAAAATKSPKSASSSTKKNGPPAKTKKGDKPTKAQSSNNEKASKLTKRFGRGGAQQQQAALALAASTTPSSQWTTTMMCTAFGLRDPMLDIVLQSSEAVLISQSERLWLSTNLLDPQQQQ